MIKKWADVELRGEDREGSGAFAAPRGGKRHKGVDYRFAEGDPVFSPVDGIVTRIGWAYANDIYRLVEILSHKGYLLWRFLYIAPLVKAGDKVKRGQTIGTAQAISKRYGPNMTDHVHVEVNIDVAAVLGGKHGEDET